MIYTDLVQKAMRIAFHAHAGQLDKGGYPYIAHPLHLAEQMDSSDETVVALLHDVIEDSDWTAEKLLQFGIPKDLVDIVELLTRKKDEPYKTYINRLAENSLARKVKMADLRHNMSLSRCEMPNSLYERYAKALEILEAYEKEERLH